MQPLLHFRIGHLAMVKCLKPFNLFANLWAFIAECVDGHAIANFFVLLRKQSCDDFPISITAAIGSVVMLDYMVRFIGHCATPDPPGWNASTATFPVLWASPIRVLLILVMLNINIFVVLQS